MSLTLTREAFEALLKAYADAFGAAVISGKAADIEKAANAYAALIKAVFP